MPHEDPETRTYPLNPMRRLPLNFMFSLFVLGGAAMPIFGKPEDRSIMLGIGTVFVLFGAGFYWLLGRTRLHVSPSGIKARYLWLLLETPWSNVESLRMDRGQEAFITSAPMDGSGPRQMAANGAGPAYDSTARHWMALKRYIPIEGFSTYLHRGLGEDIRRFAPHLAAALDAGPPPPDPAAPKTKWGWIILITVAFAAAVLVPTILAPQQMGKFMNIAWAIFMPFIALQSAWSAAKAFRRKRILAGIFGVLFAIIFVLFTLAAIGTMVGPEKPEKTKASKAAAPSPKNGNE